MKPGELVAVMGPSGSGKTTLLNLLAGRSNLAAMTESGYEFSSAFVDSDRTGHILRNGQEFTGSDFNVFGGFVQQDDTILGTSTPRELFTFACQVRTDLSDSQIAMRVGSLVSKLGLQACQDTYIGNLLVKGISGGERKRCSIGYELITNPSCLLLDEPTSGLDSTTALEVVKLLKNEARRGMSILATIHQPSSDLFHKFDRIILLADGRLIYNDKPSKAAEYF